MLTPLEADSLSILPGIRHGFFTRQGGTSRGLYASLNCGAGSKDDPVAVIENRSRVAQHLGSFGDDVQTIYQVHSADAHVVDQLVPRESLPKADALVTRTRGLVIGVLTADCAPVLFADAEAKVVGAAHAGWRGAIGGVLEATVAAMEGLGAERSRIFAALGPCIGPKSYEVGPEFVAEFEQAEAGNARFFAIPKGRKTPHFDLPSYVMHRLNQLGLRKTERHAPCTYENESMFYSFRRATHRKEPDYGRQISAIVVA
ncbi:peptidoglycan editing factor PgeF [Hyphomicrobium sp.]|uniref:peptidoglycan editing factor PgeF n=1 Tax=Hyphomicrobium sp. TaxID=82 RepID=UPI002E30648D|nr:peptidoglycan editing factor PgeF [Hyphomicrobium sp.]HEX2839864.1 peptidoglycan editing factor PgeF [Hyphomicrobium sp.]